MDGTELTDTLHLTLSIHPNLNTHDLLMFDNSAGVQNVNTTTHHLVRMEREAKDENKERKEPHRS